VKSINEVLRSEKIDSPSWKKKPAGGFPAGCPKP